jgi:hypothetical protein
VEGGDVSDQIQLSFGVEPWRGARDATVGDVFDFYDMPLVGHLTQHGVDYVFQCAEGVVLRGNVWLYAQVDKSELAQLNELEDQAFDDLLNEIMGSRDVSLALADHDRIVGMGLLEGGTIGVIGLTEAIRRWFVTVEEASTMARR